MTYTLAPEIAIKPLVRTVGRFPPTVETVDPLAIYRLDSGDLVAMRYEAKVVEGNNLSCWIIAWMVDEEGDAQMDLNGRLVGVEFKHTADPKQVIRMGADGLATELRKLVFGQIAPMAEFPGGSDNNNPIGWSQEIQDQNNIAYAIAIAKAVGTVDLAAL